MFVLLKRKCPEQSGDRHDEPSIPFLRSSFYMAGFGMTQDKNSTKKVEEKSNKSYFSIKCSFANPPTKNRQKRILTNQPTNRPNDVHTRIPPPTQHKHTNHQATDPPTDRCLLHNLLIANKHIFNPDVCVLATVSRPNVHSSIHPLSKSSKFHSFTKVYVNERNVRTQSDSIHSMETIVLLLHNGHKHELLLLLLLPFL